MMKVTLNGKEREVESPLTVEALLESFRINPRLVVVERNVEIVHRSQYSGETVEENDRLEVVQMMAGG